MRGRDQSALGLGIRFVQDRRIHLAIPENSKSIEAGVLSYLENYPLEEAYLAKSIATTPGRGHSPAVETMEKKRSGQFCSGGEVLFVKSRINSANYAVVMSCDQLSDAQDVAFQKKKRCCSG